MKKSDQILNAVRDHWNIEAMNGVKIHFRHYRMNGQDHVEFKQEGGSWEKVISFAKNPEYASKNR